MKTAQLIVMLMAFTSTTSLAQGKLEKAKKSLSEKSSETSYTSDDDNDHDTGFFEGFVIELLSYATYGTFIGEIRPRFFYSYPYEDGNHGEYKYFKSGIKGNRSKLLMSNTSVAQSDLYGNDLRLNYRFIPVLGAEASHLHFFGNDGGDTELGISSLMLNYYRIRERSVSAYWGIGATYAGNDVNTWGFSYNLGLDIYATHPVSFGLFWKQAFINERSINEFHVLARYHLRRIALEGGFFHYQLGGENFPCAGLGVSFRY